MNATHERRTALLRAYGLEIDLATVGDEDCGPVETPAPTPAEEQEQRVERYAARVLAGLPLHPGQRLTRRDRAELAKTDPDAPTVATLRKQAGRKSLASKTNLPFAQRLNRDCRALAVRLAKRFRGGPVPVPAAVLKAFAGEAGLGEKWAEHVRTLARGQAGRWGVQAKKGGASRGR